MLKNSKAESGLAWEKRTLFMTPSIKSFERAIWDALRECCKDRAFGEVLIMRKIFSTAASCEVENFLANDVEQENIKRDRSCIILDFAGGILKNCFGGGLCGVQSGGWDSN